LDAVAALQAAGVALAGRDRRGSGSGLDNQMMRELGEKPLTRNYCIPRSL
jgi:hypothetical protein